MNNISTTDLMAFREFAKIQVDFWLGVLAMGVTKSNAEGDLEDAQISVEHYSEIIQMIDAEMFERTKAVFGENPIWEK